jgi:hypothetical protein
MDMVATSNEENEHKKRAQLVMHVTSEDHRMNVTDSDNGKYHQRNVTTEKELTSQVHGWEERK